MEIPPKADIGKEKRARKLEVGGLLVAEIPANLGSQGSGCCWRFPYRPCGNASIGIYRNLYGFRRANSTL
jgi:hypothetical protein